IPFTGRALNRTSHQICCSHSTVATPPCISTPPPTFRSPHFPYTTLFRSLAVRRARSPVGIEVPVVVPSLPWHLVDAVGTRGQPGPELVQVVGVGVASADPDDGDVSGGAGLPHGPHRWGRAGGRTLPLPLHRGLHPPVRRRLGRDLRGTEEPTRVGVPMLQEVVGEFVDTAVLEEQGLGKLSEVRLHPPDDAHHDDRVDPE